MKTKNMLFFSLLLLGFGLSSCNRENADWTFEQDNAVSSELFQDLYKQIDETGQSEGSLKNCSNITISDTVRGSFPKTVTIDFGTGCSVGGRTRSGVITAIFTGRWRDAGTNITVTLNNYKVNQYSVQGTATFTNNGLNNNGNLNYTVSFANGVIRDTTNNQTLSWSGTKNYEMVAGQNTDFATNGVAGIEDDIYHITGSASGVNRNGTPFTAQITERLVRDMSCKWITDGTIEMTPQNGSTRTLNFGDGACDANVSFSYRRWTFNFLLP